MTTTASQNLTAELGAKADRYLWGTSPGTGLGITPPIITRGEGVYIYDSNGKRYIDGLSGCSSCRSATAGRDRRSAEEAG